MSKEFGSTLIRVSRLGAVSTPLYGLILRTADLQLCSDLKGVVWRDYISTCHRSLGKFWTSFLFSVAFVLYKYEIVASDIQRLLLCYGGQYYVMRKTDKHVQRSFDRCVSVLFPFSVGDGVVEYGSVDFGTGRPDFDEEMWSNLSELVILWGIGWFRHFRMLPGEELRPGKYDAVSFNGHLDVAYSRLTDWERGIVDDYVSYWSENSVPLDLSSEGESSSVVLSGDSSSLSSALVDSESISSKIKDMGDWTVEDFWAEMTDLYSKCKSAEDVRSMKQILEMKARSMGILDDGDKGTTNNIILIQQKAMTALESLGISKRIVYEQ